MNEPSWGQDDDVWERSQDARPRTNRWIFSAMAMLALVGGVVAGFVTEPTFQERAAGPRESSSLAGGLAGPSATAANNSSVPEIDPDSFLIELRPDYSFHMVGTLSSQETFDLVTVATESTYDDYAKLDGLKFDSEQSARQWENALPRSIQAIPILINGSVEITPTETIISGQTPDEQVVDILEQYFTSEDGFPPIRTAIEVVDSKPTTLTIIGSGTKVSLAGVLPNEQVRTAVVEAAEKQYGTDNVTDNIETDPDRFARFQVIRASALLPALRAFDEFEYGFRDAEFYLVLSAGMSFGPDATAIDEDTATRLEPLVPFMNHTDLDINLTGYTDSAGSSEVNKALSLARAQAVANYLEEAGVSKDRLVVEGLGESNFLDPDNTESEVNRRVEFTIGYGS